ncbi:hypothetical protein [Microbispora hainanensis]|uniref:Uncharacterized protein n=1 Tax=Microbispora hainanensis TaxID=568844 RepID=A0A544XXU7_9ACTN|nr:hypothetical protein [Microbispora hainanensis]TQS09301.1 hypothetical protein FLX08_38710 [Microbispora hainanensis]
MNHDWTRKDLTLPAEFDGDEQALAEIHQRVGWGHTVRYAVEHIRTERAEAAERARVRAELEQAGIRITGDILAGALTLTRLAAVVEGFDPDTHTTCEGHGVFLRSRGTATPVAYCTGPERHGYAPRETPSAPGAPVSGPAASARPTSLSGGWSSRATVRGRPARPCGESGSPACWPAPPRPSRCWPGSPGNPLRDKLTGARHTALWAKLTGNIDAASTAAVRPGRLPLLALAPIAVAYEHQMTVGWRLADHLRTDLALDALASGAAATAGGWRGLRRPIAAVSVL